MSGIAFGLDGSGMRNFRLRSSRQPSRRDVGEAVMDELAYFHQMDAATLSQGALSMMLFGGIVAIDYWVGARRSDSPRRGTGRPT